MVNAKIKPRALTPDELEARRRGEYDSFANYLVFCPKCGHMAKTNMYVMRAEAYISELGDRPCPACGAQGVWTLGYPSNSKTGFVSF